MIVGLTGFKGSGKSAVANAFQQHGYHYAPFAGPLKQMVFTLLSIRGMHPDTASRHVWGDLKEVPIRELEGKSARWAMQTIGTEWGRNLIGTDLWTNTWLDSIQHKALVVVDDVRFPNEVAMIRDMNGYLIRVERAGIESKDVHPSEMHIPHLQVDAVLHNDGPLRKLVALAHNTACELAGDLEERHEDEDIQ